MHAGHRSTVRLRSTSTCVTCQAEEKLSFLLFSQHSPLGMCNDREDAMRESMQRRWGHTCHCALGLGISPAATLVL